MENYTMHLKRSEPSETRVAGAVGNVVGFLGPSGSVHCCPSSPKAASFRVHQAFTIQLLLWLVQSSHCDGAALNSRDKKKGRRVALH